MYVGSRSERQDNWVNNYGGNFDLYLRTQLVDNGIDPKNDVRIVEIPVFPTIGAITTHTIDAGFLDTIFAAVALKNNSNELAPVFSYRDVGLLRPATMA